MSAALARALSVLENLNITTEAEVFTSEGLFSTSVDLNDKYGFDLSVLSLARDFSEGFSPFDVSSTYGEEDRTLNIYLEICNVTVFNVYLIFGESQEPTPEEVADSNVETV